MLLSFGAAGFVFQDGNAGRGAVELCPFPIPFEPFQVFGLLNPFSGTPLAVRRYPGRGDDGY